MIEISFDGHCVRSVISIIQMGAPQGETGSKDDSQPRNTPKASTRLPEIGEKGAAVAAGKHGLATEQFPVSAYVGSSKNLKDLTG